MTLVLPYEEVPRGTYVGTARSTRRDAATPPAYSKTKGGAGRRLPVEIVVRRSRSGGRSAAPTDAASFEMGLDLHSQTAQLLPPALTLVLIFMEVLLR